MREFVNYREAMSILNLSEHPNQLAKRVKKYPHHFIKIIDEVYVSWDYVEALIQWQQVEEKLNNLRKGGAQ